MEGITHVLSPAPKLATKLRREAGFMTVDGNSEGRVSDMQPSPRSVMFTGLTRTADVCSNNN